MTTQTAPTILDIIARPPREKFRDLCPLVSKSRLGCDEKLILSSAPLAPLSRGINLFEVELDLVGGPVDKAFCNIRPRLSS